MGCINFLFWTVLILGLFGLLGKYASDKFLLIGIGITVLSFIFLGLVYLIKYYSYSRKVDETYYKVQKLYSLGWSSERILIRVYQLKDNYVWKANVEDTPELYK